MAYKAGGAQIRKMGTRAGQPHYGVNCVGCPATYGVDSVLAVGHLSKEGAKAVHDEHVASDHGRNIFHDRRDTNGPWGG